MMNCNLITVVGFCLATSSPITGWLPQRNKVRLKISRVIYKNHFKLRFIDPIKSNQNHHSYSHFVIKILS
ncbi:hypothetical protein O181_039427 [Austropuccinia psidii MF-1]|uniref:Secreted protein n=1 Tax=Austropuccinia psidii MF-1 TaxID=1389203 RepID=A0A9Q3DGS7_9BASI|nr:hypothetical protein [Austropuccinia psidii MF-1]